MAQELLSVRDISNELEKRDSALASNLGGMVPSDKFRRIVMTTITQNPDIRECSMPSIMAECMKAAADGLVLDGREAALVFRDDAERIFQDRQGNHGSVLPGPGSLRPARSPPQWIRNRAFGNRQPIQ